MSVVRLRIIVALASQMPRQKMRECRRATAPARSFLSCCPRRLIVQSRLATNGRGKKNTTTLCQRALGDNSIHRHPKQNHHYFDTIMNVVKRQPSSSSKLPKSPKDRSGRITSGSHATKINLYQTIPQIEVSLDEFEEYALARLKVGLYWILKSMTFVMTWSRWTIFRVLASSQPL